MSECRAGELASADKRGIDERSRDTHPPNSALSGQERERARFLGAPFFAGGWVGGVGVHASAVRRPDAFGAGR
jgi:hypothetical protein